MANTIEYKGYIAKIEYSGEDEVFFGKLEGIRDLVNFEGASVQELQQAFRDSVDEYLAFCKEVGKEPEKAYKGSFNVRISPERHRALDLRAKRDGDSLNRAVEKAIEGYLQEPSRSNAQRWR